MSDKELQHQILILGKRIHYLNSKGKKYKEISEILGIYPSALSVLLNKVIPKLNPDDPTILREVFKTVNNLSIKKLENRIGNMLNTLESINYDSIEYINNKDHSYISKRLSRNDSKPLIYTQGIYDCYYISTNQYKVKREPLLLQKIQHSNSGIAVKGNIMSMTQYKGEYYTSNDKLLTIQIFEKEGLTSDHFIAHFLLPPSYSISFSMLSGVAISLSNNSTPIARKIIIERITKHVNIDDYHALTTEYFTKSELENSIVEYLYQGNSVLEYLPIPYPNYDSDDLEKEVSLKRILAQ